MFAASFRESDVASTSKSASNNAIDDDASTGASETNGAEQGQIQRYVKFHTCHAIRVVSL